MIGGKEKLDRPDYVRCTMGAPCGFLQWSSLARTRPQLSVELSVGVMLSEVRQLIS